MGKSVELIGGENRENYECDDCPTYHLHQRYKSMYKLSLSACWGCEKQSLQLLLRFI